MAEVKKLRLTPKRRAWLDAYVGEAAGDGTKAAQIAGMGNAHSCRVAGSRLKHALADVIAAWKLKQHEAKKMGQEEALELLAGVARGERDASTTELKALELVLKVEGALNDKLDIRVTKEELLAQLDKEAGQMLRLIEAKVEPIGKLA